MLFKWCQDPRTNIELVSQEGQFPAKETVPFGSREALSPPTCTEG